MNISGIRPTIGFYDYNDIRAKQVERLAEVATPVEPVAKVTEQKAEDVEASIQAARARQTFGAYDYAKQYDSRETYSLKGADSDLMSLDVTKAVDDMHKDSAIQQYQYFVGNKDSQTAEVTASIRGAENFTL